MLTLDMQNRVFIDKHPWHAECLVRYIRRSVLKSILKPSVKLLKQSSFSFSSACCQYRNENLTILDPVFSNRKEDNTLKGSSAFLDNQRTSLLRKDR